MPFKKINTEEELKKVVDKDLKIKTYIDAAYNQNKLIRSLMNIREDLHLTQKEVAELSGPSQNEVSNLEKMYSSPRLDVFLKYVNALNVQIEFKKND